MIDMFKTYETYKDSGVPWLGNLPSHWDVVRNKSIFIERSQRSITGEETLLTVSHITGVTPRSEKNVNMFMADSMAGYKVCQQGDLLINTMWAWMGALGTSRHMGICSPAYGVYAPRKGVPYDFRYFDYLYRTPHSIAEMTRNSKGIVSSRLRLYTKEFYRIATILPPLEEQRAIADYLDGKTAVIDQKITLLTQKAAQYSQLKQSLINETVTRGLDKTVPIKESGVDWLGQIPSHWKIDRLKKTLLDSVNGAWGELANGGNDDIICVRVADFDRNLLRITNHNLTIRAVEEHQRKRLLLKKGDLLLEKSGGGDLQPVGKVVLFDLPSLAICSNFIAKMSLRSSYYPNYICYLHSVLYSLRRVKRSIKQNTGIQNLSSASYFDELVAFPPYDEQLTIANFLDQKTNHINSIIKTIDKQIEKLKELRKSLINDVVTGKIKVVDLDDSHLAGDSHLATNGGD